MNNILDKVKAIAVYRVFFVKTVWELAINKNDSEFNKKQAEGNAFFALNAVTFIGTSLGFQFSERDLVPAGNDLIYPTRHFVKNCIEKDQLANSIELSYGVSARRTFEISQSVAIIFQLSSLLSAFSEQEYDDFLEKQSKEVFSLFTKFIGIYDSFITSLTLSNETLHLFNQLANHLQKDVERNQNYHVKTVSLSIEIIGDLVPAYSEMANRAVRAAQLMLELRSCKPGRKEWAKYENVCIEILKFSFIPPFRSVFIQARTSDGYERRDAVLPNNQYDGFYGALRQEFDTKNIVCEFKNIASNFDKSLLNQLRIYLSKPTVGRFGLLFIRGEPDSTLLKAQRDAYEQSKILVLIITDELINDLLMARVYLGSVETIIENEKTRFEIQY